MMEFKEVAVPNPDPELETEQEQDDTENKGHGGEDDKRLELHYQVEEMEIENHDKCPQLIPETSTLENVEARNLVATFLGANESIPEVPETVETVSPAGQEIAVPNNDNGYMLHIEEVEEPIEANLLNVTVFRDGRESSTITFKVEQEVGNLNLDRGRERESDSGVEDADARKIKYPQGLQVSPILGNSHVDSDNLNIGVNEDNLQSFAMPEENMESSQVDNLNLISSTSDEVPERLCSAIRTTAENTWKHCGALQVFRCQKKAGDNTIRLDGESDMTNPIENLRDPYNSSKSERNVLISSSLLTTEEESSLSILNLAQSSSSAQCITMSEEAQVGKYSAPSDRRATKAGRKDRNPKHIPRTQQQEQSEYVKDYSLPRPPLSSESTTAKIAKRPYIQKKVRFNQDQCCLPHPSFQIFQDPRIFPLKRGRPPKYHTMFGYRQQKDFCCDNAKSSGGGNCEYPASSQQRNLIIPFPANTNMLQPPLPGRHHQPFPTPSPSMVRFPPSASVFPSQAGQEVFKYPPTPIDARAAQLSQLQQHLNSAKQQFEHATEFSEWYCRYLHEFWNQNTDWAMGLREQRTHLTNDPDLYPGRNEGSISKGIPAYPVGLSKDFDMNPFVPPVPGRPEIPPFPNILNTHLTGGQVYIPHLRPPHIHMGECNNGPEHRFPPMTSAYRVNSMRKPHFEGPHDLSFKDFGRLGAPLVRHRYGTLENIHSATANTNRAVLNLSLRSSIQPPMNDGAIERRLHPSSAGTYVDYTKCQNPQCSCQSTDTRDSQAFISGPVMGRIDTDSRQPRMNIISAGGQMSILETIMRATSPVPLEVAERQQPNFVSSSVLNITAIKNPLRKSDDGGME